VEAGAAAKPAKDAGGGTSAEAGNGQTSDAKQQAIKSKYDPSRRIDPLASADRVVDSNKNISLLDEASLKKLNDAQKKRIKDVAGSGSEGEEEEEELEEDDEEANRVVYVDHFRAPAGKKISMPVRIEPKVVFAAERTFLKVSSIPS
jgi:hypothetical protein